MTHTDSLEELAEILFVHDRGDVLEPLWKDVTQHTRERYLFLAEEVQGTVMLDREAAAEPPVSQPPSPSQQELDGAKHEGYAEAQYKIGLSLGQIARAVMEAEVAFKRGLLTGLGVMPQYSAVTPKATPPTNKRVVVGLGENPVVVAHGGEKLSQDEINRAVKTARERAMVLTEPEVQIVSLDAPLAESPEIEEMIQHGEDGSYRLHIEQLNEQMRRHGVPPVPYVRTECVANSTVVENHVGGFTRSAHQPRDGKGTHFVCQSCHNVVVKL